MEVYFDHQSATAVRPEVLEAMRPFFADGFGNPSSLHHHGLLVRDAMDKARAQVAAFLQAESAEEIIFTSDGTESANLAVKGAALAGRRNGNHLVVSQSEHPSVLASVAFLEGQGLVCDRVPVDADGIIDPARVEAAMSDQTILVAVHHVNHEIGAIEPVAAIGAVARERGVPFYVDADAGAGWLPLDVGELGAALLSFSPHRFGGPKGVGVLYQNRRVRLAPMLHGGPQEQGRRAGVENVPAIIGAGMAVEIAQREMTQRHSHCARLQRRLWDGLRATVPFLKLNGPIPGPKRQPANLNISVEFIEGEAQLLLCDMQGIAIASGSACAGNGQKNSHVLEAIGLPAALARGNIILSLGPDNTMEEVEYFLATFPKIVAKLRDLSPHWSEFQKGLTRSMISPA
jgi:cysteine desulfurase